MDCVGKIVKDGQTTDKPATFAVDASGALYIGGGAFQPPIEQGRQFFLSPGAGGDDLGIPAGLDWPGRASVTTFVDAYGLVTEIPADCLAAPGYRLEHTLTTGVVTETVTVEVSSEYQIVIAGDAGAQVVCSGSITGTITADGAQRWTFTGDGSPKTATTTSLVLTVTGTLTELGVYPVTGRSNQNPPEYVSVGVESAPMYHGAGVDGYKYFSTQLANTVNPDGSINEAVGAALPGPLRLRLEETQTNKIKYTRDLTQSDWVPGTNKLNTLTNDGIGIDGTASASRIVVNETLPTGYVAFGQTMSATNQSSYCVTVYVKREADRRTQVALFLNVSSSRRTAARVYHNDLSTELFEDDSGDGQVLVTVLGDFIRIAVYCPNIWGDVTEVKLDLFANTPVAGGLVNNDVTIFDGINLFAGMDAYQAINESVIFDEAVNDPRAADAPLIWDLEVPRPEGMAILEAELPATAGKNGGLISFSTASYQGWMYTADSGDDLYCYDGTSVSSIQGLSGSATNIAASRWGPDGKQVSRLRASDNAWIKGPYNQYDGTPNGSANRVTIGYYSGASTVLPIYIKTVSIYDEDRGGDFITGNWPT